MALPPLGPSGREADDAQWLELTGKSGMAINVSPVHRLRISGPGPNSLTALPKDNRPVNRARGEAILAWFEQLGARLRATRIACGSWERVVTESVTTRHGLTGILLDPPYGNPAALGPARLAARPVDRWLCVPASRRDCPDHT